MANFVLIYRGGKPPQTDEEKDKVMADWGAWFEALGDKLVEGGNPLGPPKVTDGSEVSEPASGYSIIKADDQDAAVELAQGCPLVKDGGRAEVYEAFPM
jgi:hypothetical protein